jgi:hypothetical protein
LELQEMEARLQEQIAKVQEERDGLALKDWTYWRAWLECTNALVQVKQAIFLASIASSLDSIVAEKRVS